MTHLFSELLQVSLGTREHLSRVPSSVEWEGIYYEAEKHAVVGLLVVGLERLPKRQQPPLEILLQWIGVSQQIETQNLLVTQACQQVCYQLEQDGFIACVLKGQSNYRYYSAELHNKRSCGDVDVWVRPNIASKHPVKTVIEYVQRSFKMDGLCWLHTSHKDESGVPVEIHLRASFMSEPITNRRFQKHFADVGACRDVVSLDGVEIPVMKVDEDVIYQMNHIYRHLIDEGVGLRQVVDYYYLLRTWNEKHIRTKEETMKTISFLGMRKFAGALMYVLREMCGMEEEFLLCPATVTDGKFLMNEIMLSGNFGHADSRMTDVSANSYYDARVKQAWRRLMRNMRFLTSYPGEVIWEPIVRVEHFVWKKLKLWRF